MGVDVRLVGLRMPCPRCGGALYRSIIGIGPGDATNPETFRQGPVRCSHQGCKLDEDDFDNTELTG